MLRVMTRWVVAFMLILPTACESAAMNREAQQELDAVNAKANNARTRANL